MKTLKHDRGYFNARKAKYPSPGEQFDAIFKFAEAMKEAGFPMPQTTEAWIEKCREIKDKHPKPADNK